MEKFKRKFLVMVGVFGIVLIMAFIVVVITIYNAQKVVNDSHNDFNVNKEFYNN